MGAGKTVTGIAAVELLHTAGLVSSGWIFCPNSIKFQWLDEIRRHVGPVAQVVDGPRESRLWQYKHARRFRYNICNYDALRNDLQLITNWVSVPDFVIADEATQIKSARAKRSKVLKKLSREVPYRFALTGQPIENRPEELFSIMEFVDRDVLGPFTTFDRTFILRDHWGRPVRYRNMGVLRDVMEPVMLRKSRKDIEEFLPQINTVEIPIALPSVVMDLYDFIAQDTLEVIEAILADGGMGGWNVMAAYGRTDKEAGGRGKGEIMSRLTCMRLLCDHPALLALSADNFDDPDSTKGSRYASWLRQQGYLDGVSDSTKLDAAVELITTILDEDPDNRVVLFAFFKPLLWFLGDRLKKEGVQPVYLTGDMSAAKRRESLSAFTGPARVMLSSDAGQYGIDLPHVNYLISYDLPWSAGAFAQRTARIDRTSSHFPHINVITMMAKGTIEQRQFDMLTQKRVVSEAWIDGKHLDAKGGLTLTLDTLKQFLQAG